MTLTALHTQALEDYINPDDGLRYCGKCHAPKEQYFEPGQVLFGMDRHPIECSCAHEKREKREATERASHRASQMQKLRSEAFRDVPAALWTFKSAGTMTPQLEKVKRYAEHWDEFRKDGQGLLLFGNVGTGKSYAAGCVANALINEMHTVRYTTISDAVNRMQGKFGADREEYLQTLLRPDLLILDDLGAERSTSYGKEQVFTVIDKRVLSGKPMIVTTNIPLNLMQNAADLDDRRIYERILSVCVPILFDGENFRKGIAAEGMKKAMKLLKG